MEDGAGNVSGQFGQFFIALVLHARFELFGRKRLHRFLRHDAARYAQAVGSDFAVLGGGQVVGRNGRCVFKAGAGDVHSASAGWVQVAHTGRDGGEAVQRLAKRIQTQRLNVVLDVGVGLRRVALGERAQLTRCHAHGACALESVFQPDHRFAPQAVGQGVEGFGPFDFVHRADLQMVLQVGPDAGQVVLHFNANTLQHR